MEHTKIQLKNFKHNRSVSGIFSNLKFSAKKRNINVKFSKEEFIVWYNLQEKKCYYCGRTIEETKNDIGLNSKNYRLSIDRKNNDIGYEPNNIVLACNRCNNIKGSFF
jgi:5-methylcytosine-specific restriction endonuclease McrA